MTSDGLYTTLMRATQVLAVLLGLVAGATAISLQAPAMALWVVAAGTVAWWAGARHRSRRQPEAPAAQAKSSAMSS